jgi:hypothetical protein
MRSDITLRPDGSGLISLEYRISRTLESLGKLDGNERWLPLPVGRADFERTLERLPGLKMLSFSSREDGKDLIIGVKMEFSNLDALLHFLDASGQKAVLVNQNGRRRLDMSFRGAGRNDREMDEFFAALAEDYRVSMKFILPSEGSLELLDGQGKSGGTLPGEELVGRGKELFWSLPLPALMGERERRLVLSW